MSNDRPPCPPDEHCPSCTRDEEDECHRCGMSREDRYAQFNAWLDEVDDDDATVIDAADAFPRWTHRTCACVDVDLRSPGQRDRMPRILTEGADWTGASILGRSSGPGAAP